MRLLPCLLLLPFLAAAADGPIDWPACTRSAGYAAATAWSPGFTDRTLWPSVTGTEAFVTQPVKPGRLLRWAHPGKGAGIKVRGSKLDPYDAANWIDVATGKPPATLFDKDTDVWLPASETPYTVGMQKAGQEHAQLTLRSLTVESGASWYTSGLAFHGSIWVKRGGRIGNHGATVPAGGSHAFYRHDNGDPRVAYDPADKAGNEVGHVSQYIKMDKPGGSCEFIGTFSLVDEFQVNAGTLIVGPDSRLQPGRNATPRVAKEATLALMDGAWFGKWTNQVDLLDMELYGSLLGGLPDRPLRRSCTWALGFRNWNGTRIPAGNQEREKEWNTRRVGAMIHEGAVLRSHSADPASARLVVAWNGLPSVWGIDVAGTRGNPADQDPAVREALGRIPRLIDLWIAGDAVVEGVLFDHLRTGGLLVGDAAAAGRWRNVAYGPACAGAASTLVVQAAKPGKGGTY